MPVSGWIKNRKELMKPQCECCGATENLHLHHNNQDRMNNSPDNLQTLCASCHTKWHWGHGKTAKRLHPLMCTVCGNPAYRSGLCNTHRTRQRRYGSPYLTRMQGSGHVWQLILDPSILNGLERHEFHMVSRTASTDLNASETPSSPKSSSGSAKPSSKRKCGNNV